MGETISWSVAVVISVIAICAASAYSCTETSRQYYESANKCIEKNGSWIPDWSSGGTCVKGKMD